MKQIYQKNDANGGYISFKKVVRVWR